MNPETSGPEEVILPPIAEAPEVATNSISMSLYKTTEGNYVVKTDAGEAFFDSKGNPYNGTIESFGVPTTKVRSDSAIFKKLQATVSEVVAMKNKLIPVDNIKGFEVLFNKEDMSLCIDIRGQLVNVDKAGLEKIKAEVEKFEKIKMELTASSSIYRTGDRVMLYGPTGTGKTYDFLSSVLGMKADGRIDEFCISTITEGFEDIDFIAHIVPTDKGITYVETKIVTLLREASQGKKVAILLDELNRGSKSFLNLILKLLDAVDGKTYTLNNFVKDEQIVIPIENVLFFATMNLGGKYVGTNALDEALLDRFNIVQYKGYNLDVEKDMEVAFAPYQSEANQITKYVRELHKEGEIRAPISTRGVKMWAESFLNSPKTKEDLMGSFNYTLMNRLISVDDFGNPNQEEIALIMKKFKDLKIIS